MKSKILMAALLSGVVLAAGAAQAQNGGGRPDFAMLDLNGDGSLTQDELRAQGEARFARVDTNGDGGLSVDELTAATGDRARVTPAEMIEENDANGDGTLQLTEMPRRGGGDREGQMFTQADANGDGVLSEAEFEAAQEQRADRRGPATQDRG